MTVHWNCGRVLQGCLEGGDRPVHVLHGAVEPAWTGIRRETGTTGSTVGARGARLPVLLTHKRGWAPSCVYPLVKISYSDRGRSSSSALTRVHVRECTCTCVILHSDQALHPKRSRLLTHWIHHGAAPRVSNFPSRERRKQAFFFKKKKKRKLVDKFVKVYCNVKICRDWEMKEK